MVQPRRAADPDLPEPPQVRRLRRLVSLLILVLIGGMLVVAAAMVAQLGAFRAAPEAPLAPISAGALALPAGAEVIALGRGPGEVLILTRSPDGVETLRAFDAATGAERSATPIQRE
jgi:hypothetical protein